MSDAFVYPNPEWGVKSRRILKIGDQESGG